jgi:hypothetical protein
LAISLSYITPCQITQKETPPQHPAECASKERAGWNPSTTTTRTHSLPHAAHSGLPRQAALTPPLPQARHHPWLHPRSASSLLHEADPCRRRPETQPAIQKKTRSACSVRASAMGRSTVSVREWGRRVSRQSGATPKSRDAERERCGGSERRQVSREASRCRGGESEGDDDSTCIALLSSRSWPLSPPPMVMGVSSS